MKKISLLVLSAASMALFAYGCTTDPAKMATDTNCYDIVGETVGESSGYSLLGMIPIRTLDRFERAYEEAIESKDADALISTVLTDRSIWTPGGTIYLTTVKGIAVRYKCPKCGCSLKKESEAACEANLKAATEAPKAAEKGK